MNVKTILSMLVISMGLLATSCDPKKTNETNNESGKSTEKKSEFDFLVEKFADAKIIRYQIPAWDKLTLKQKELVYYLTQAGYAGRDIMYDQNFRYGLEIRQALEKIYTDYKGDKTSEDWKAFETYIKRMWLSNGIFHHYANDKFETGFSKDYLTSLLENANAQLSPEAFTAIFDQTQDTKKVNLDPKKDLVLASSINFYGTDVTAEEVEQFYAEKSKNDGDKPVEHGLNSKLVKENGKLAEKTWKIGGMYSAAIEKIVYWLEKAVTVAENPKQEDALKLLIDYYKTGDLQTWVQYNIAWTQATEGDIDYINGFIEVYNDPKGYRGSYESIVQIKDFDMTEKMAAIASEAQYFEHNSPIMDSHKKENVTGVSYKVVNVAGESGDASPTTPIGVNLPNNNWIRAQHGSKSVSLGNIVYAYSQAGGSDILEEFAYDQAEIERSKAHQKDADKMMVALHEVIGHGSGKLNKGVGTPKQTLKNYASTLEEVRADLVALYYMPDPRLIELGLLESEEVAKASYDYYMRNGLMTQLTRINPEADIEEAHMRNRQIVAKWALERGASEKVVELIEKDKKTYIKINDYQKLRTIFGELLRETQRIKSEGDYQAGRDLVENYGVKVDQAIHKEVLARVAPLKIAPYGGFVNPRLEPVLEDGTIIDIKVTYDEAYDEQMLRYAKEYGTLPIRN